MGDTTMTEYTPATDHIIEGFRASPAHVWPDRDPASYLPAEGESRSAFMERQSIDAFELKGLSYAAVRRWLAAHDAEVAANARAEAWTDARIFAATRYSLFDSEAAFVRFVTGIDDRIAREARADGSTPIGQQGDPQPNPELSSSEGSAS